MVKYLWATAQEAAAAALIEDFFAVNEDVIVIPRADPPLLIEPFCVEGDSVFKFELSATFTSANENR